VVSEGECKSDIEINFELSKRFKPDFPWKGIEEMYDHILKPAGMTYKELGEKGWVLPPKGHPSAPYRRYEKGLLRQDKKPGFLTPSGKIELYSSWLERWELDPLPYYEEPPFSPISTPDLYKEYPLILTTGRRSSAYFHSEHRMIPWLREIEPDPIVEIHPETAEGPEPSLFGVWEVNVNQLIPMGHTGKSGYGCPLKSILCKVYKVGGE
jgi:anaerobic selenocysteine-containing dehydrogenase